MKLKLFLFWLIFIQNIARFIWNPGKYDYVIGNIFWGDCDKGEIGLKQVLGQFCPGDSIWY